MIKVAEYIESWVFRTQQINQYNLNFNSGNLISYNSLFRVLRIYQFSISCRVQSDFVLNPIFPQTQPNIISFRIILLKVPNGIWTWWAQEDGIIDIRVGYQGRIWFSTRAQLIFGLHLARTVEGFIEPWTGTESITYSVNRSAFFHQSGKRRISQVLQGCSTLYFFHSIRTHTNLEKKIYCINFSSIFLGAFHSNKASMGLLFKSNKS